MNTEKHPHSYPWLTFEAKSERSPKYHCNISCSVILGTSQLSSKNDAEGAVFPFRRANSAIVGAIPWVKLHSSEKDSPRLCEKGQSR